jgi:hypothetical protein
VPDPPRRRVIPLREYLLHPFHYFRQFESVSGLDKKHEPVILKPHLSNDEGKPVHGFPEDPGEDRQGIVAAEKGFAVVDVGTDFVPDIVSE